jgi:hypothetical protein
MTPNRCASGGPAWLAEGSVDGCCTPPAVRHAPVTVRIAAPVPAVWEVLSNVRAWPTLDPGISDVSTRGPSRRGPSTDGRTGAVRSRCASFWSTPWSD